MTADVDEVAVLRLLAGDRTIPLRQRRGSGRPLTPEVIAAVRQLAGHGLNDRQIADRMGPHWAYNNITQIRHRNGIPAGRPRSHRDAHAALNESEVAS